MGQLLLSFQEWLLRIMKSTNTPTNIVVSSWLPVFFEKDLVGIPNFVNISIAIECMVVLPVGITKTETYWKRDSPMFENMRVANVVEYSGNVAPFRSVIFFIYDYNISDRARKMFSYYQRKELAQVRPWNLSTYITV